MAHIEVIEFLMNVPDQEWKYTTLLLVSHTLLLERSMIKCSLSSLCTTGKFSGQFKVNVIQDLLVHVKNYNTVQSWLRHTVVQPHLQLSKTAERTLSLKS
jgi:hypothetical protein